MSEQNNTNKKPTVYVPGTFLKEVKFSDNNSVIRLSVKLDKFAAFVKEHKKADGYINFNIYPRKETGTYGDTHSMALDQWTPDKSKSAAPKTTPVKKVEPSKSAPEPEEDFV